MQVSAECRGVRSPAAGVLGTDLAGPQEEQCVLLTLSYLTSISPYSLLLVSLLKTAGSLVIQADLELEFFWFQPSRW